MADDMLELDLNIIGMPCCYMVYNSFNLHQREYEIKKKVSINVTHTIPSCQTKFWYLCKYGKQHQEQYLIFKKN